MPNPTDIRITLDGDSWCALMGDDLQIGVATFADSPGRAMRSLTALLTVEDKQRPPSFILQLLEQIVSQMPIATLWCASARYRQELDAWMVQVEWKIAAEQIAYYGQAIATAEVTQGYELAMQASIAQSFLAKVNTSLNAAR